MTTYDLGDGVNLEHLVYDRDGALTAATVALTVTKPDATTTAPAVTAVSTGRYRAATFTTDQAGAWSYRWTVSGTVVDVADGGFAVGNPGPTPYATLPQMKSYMSKIASTDTLDDDLILSALASVTREINDVCGRTFNRAATVSARTFEPVGPGYVRFDDFYSLADLVITVGGQTWTSTDYKLLPLNGLVNGEPWPYGSLEPRGSLRLPCGYDSVSIATRYGWATVPDPVHEACKIATSETFAVKDARFGVVGWGQFGDIRVRDNPMVMKKLKPYLRTPYLVG